MDTTEDRVKKYRGRFLNKLVREHDDRPIPDSWVITPLRKICPRCGRMGSVFIDTDRTAMVGAVAIIWDAPSKAGTGGDRDTCLRIVDLFTPVFGCGYDDHD